MPKVPVVSRNMIAYLISLLPVVPFYWSLPVDPRVIERTYKYFAVGLATMANASYNNLSAHVHHKATGWYRQFPPIRSPDRADEKDLRPGFKEGAEDSDQDGAEAEVQVIEERAVEI